MNHRGLQGFNTLFLTEFEVEFIIPLLHLIKDFIVLFKTQLLGVGITPFKFSNEY